MATTSSNKEINILGDFASLFSSPEDMFIQMNSLFETTLHRDPEFKDAISQTAETFMTFNRMKSTEEKQEPVVELREYAFILFTVMKNLENEGLIKIISRPERIVNNALKEYEKGHKKPKREKK